MFISVTDIEAHRIRVNVNNIAFYHEYGNSRTSQLKTEIIFQSIADSDSPHRLRTMESPKEIDHLIRDLLEK